MVRLWTAIERFAEDDPLRAALGDYTYSGLRDAVASVYRLLPDFEGKRVGLLVGNNPVWAIFDIALTLKGAVVVPVPGFFSGEQIGHIIKDAALQVIVFDESATCSFEDGFNGLEVINADSFLATAKEDGEVSKEVNYKPIPVGKVIKIIYTSGTTGAPKGVCLTLGAIEAVTASLAERSEASSSDKHLSLLPLSTLLEAIGGVYVPLLSGASVVYPSGSIRDAVADPAKFIGLIRESEPTTTILVPALLQAFVAIAGATPGAMPGSFRFIACGGAPVPTTLLERAEALGLPVFQGYGLSECASVVAVNSPGDNRPGSVGKALAHALVRVNPDGEIIVGGAGVMVGYAGREEITSEELATGDIGYLDDEGYLYVTGRKDNVILTPLGRNVSPEWVEKEITVLQSVRQAMVLGDPAPSLSALIVPDERWLKEAATKLLPDTTENDPLNVPELAEALATEMLKEINDQAASLPEYARIKCVALLGSPFTQKEGLVTIDGRLKRKEIRSKYTETIDELHENTFIREVI